MSIRHGLFGLLVLALGSSGACALDRSGSIEARDGDGGSGALGDDTGPQGLGGAGASGLGSGDGGSPPNGSTGAGASTSSAGGAGDGGALPTSFGYERAITIAAQGATVPGGYSVRLELDHAALVLANKSLPNGDDVRIFRDTGSGPVEVDRVVDPFSSWNSATTRLYLRSTDAIATSDTSYTLYYGDPTAGVPPADPGAVYDVWDDFAGPTLATGWSTAQLGTVNSAQFTLTGGRLRLTGATEGIGPGVDDQLFAYRAASGGFVADVIVAGRGGSFGGFPNIGGLMVRTAISSSSRMRVLSPTTSTGNAYTDDYRLTSGTDCTWSDIGGSSAMPVYVRLTRLGNVTRAQYSTDLVNLFDGAGSKAFSGAVADPIYVGIPLCNDNAAATGWVETEWFRLRKHVDPEPLVTLGVEQPSSL